MNIRAVCMFFLSFVGIVMLIPPGVLLMAGDVGPNNHEILGAMVLIGLVSFIIPSSCAMSGTFKRL